MIPIIFTTLFITSPVKLNTTWIFANLDSIQIELWRLYRIQLRERIVGNTSMPKTFKIGNKVEKLRRYKNLPSIPTRIHHDVPHKAVVCFYRESRVIRLCILALLIGLAQAAYIPVYRRSSPCLSERELASLVMELKHKRSAAAFRQTVKWLVISASFHKCRVPFLGIENSTMRLQCRTTGHSNWRCVRSSRTTAHYMTVTRRSGLSLGLLSPFGISRLINSILLLYKLIEKLGYSWSRVSYLWLSM